MLKIHFEEIIIIYPIFNLPPPKKKKKMENAMLWENVGIFYKQHKKQQIKQKEYTILNRRITIFTFEIGISKLFSNRTLIYPNLEYSISVYTWLATVFQLNPRSYLQNISPDVFIKFSVHIVPSHTWSNAKCL